MAFAGIHQPEQFHAITRTHVIAWRQQLVQQHLANDTIRLERAGLPGPPAVPGPAKSCRLYGN
jgi:hypothetical protein